MSVVDLNVEFNESDPHGRWTARVRVGHERYVLLTRSMGMWFIRDDSYTSGYWDCRHPVSTIIELVGDRYPHLTEERLVEAVELLQATAELLS